MGENPAQINEWLDYLFNYGPFWVYLALFAACLIENLFPPFPGDSFIVAAGGLVAMNRLDMTTSLVLIILGGMTSVMLLYVGGRKYGRDYFIRKDFRYFSAADVLRMEQQLSRWGAVILIVSRFVVGMRAALALAAGIGRYPAGRMLVFSGISYVVFVGLLFYLAFKLVENLDHIQYYFRTYNWIVWPIVILVVGTIIVRKLLAVRNRGRK